MQTIKIIWLIERVVNSIVQVAESKYIEWFVEALMALFATDWELMLMIALMVIVRYQMVAFDPSIVVNNTSAALTWIKVHLKAFWNAIKALSLYVVILAFAQAGSNKFPLADQLNLDSFAYFSVWLFELRYILNLVAQRNSATKEVIVIIKKRLNRLVQDTNQPKGAEADDRAVGDVRGSEIRSSPDQPDSAPDDHSAPFSAVVPDGEDGGVEQKQKDDTTP